MPARGRTPGNPPRRRPKVAGHSRRTPSGAAAVAAAPSPEPIATPEQLLATEHVPERASIRDPMPAASQDAASQDAASQDAASQDAGDVRDAEPRTAAARNGRVTGVLLVVLLLLISVVLGAAALVLRGQSARAGAGPVDNRAVVDSAATSEVVAQVSKAIETVLSYDYTTLDDNERAAGEVIAGKYRDEFATTFADVRKTAPDQKLVLTTTVLLAGVTMLNGDRAEVIATMDLAAVRDTTPYNSPGRVKVIANRVDGRWKIAEMILL